MWSDHRLLNLFKIEHPIVLAPMAGAMDWQLAVEVASAGALASLPCALLTPEQVTDHYKKFRECTDKPIALNFFCHRAPSRDSAREEAWRQKLLPYYTEFGIDPAAPISAANRAPFDTTYCEIVEELRPQVVSFHFGLPEHQLLHRVKATGCVIISSATTVKEAVWLEEQGVDAVIAQGWEAGGHRGIFLDTDVSAQVGTFALVPQVADAIDIPVIAAGAIGDARGIVAAFDLGAAGVCLGSAYLHCPESKISAPHRAALQKVRDNGTAITTLMTGRPARGIVNRIMRELKSTDVTPPEFPLAAAALAPLRAKAEAQNSGDFSPMWAGQAAALGHAMGARQLTTALAVEAQALMARPSRAKNQRRSAI